MSWSSIGQFPSDHRGPISALGQCLIIIGFLEVHRQLPGTYAAKYAHQAAHHALRGKHLRMAAHIYLMAQRDERYWPDLHVRRTLR